MDFSSDVDREIFSQELVRKKIFFIIQITQENALSRQLGEMRGLSTIIYILLESKSLIVH